MFQRISFRSLAAVLPGLFLLAGMAQGQERKSRIDVENYVVDVDVNQRTQSLAAKAAVRFVPQIGRAHV